MRLKLIHIGLIIECLPIILLLLNAVAVACEDGFTDCNGVCVNTGYDSNNCGACGNRCFEGANSNPICNDSVCDLYCESGYGNCNGDPNDGCELDILTDPINCGQCGNECVFVEHGEPRCHDGRCDLDCEQGYGNCNMDYNDGCELNVLTDPANCGACGIVCDAANGFTCINGGCACPSDKPNNCNGICRECCFDSDCHNGFICINGSCACPSYQADCNGICVDIFNDINNCGACGNRCFFAEHGEPNCRDGFCGILCEPGWADCNVNPNDGCELNIWTDPANCGACGIVCDAANGFTCISGGCACPSDKPNNCNGICRECCVDANCPSDKPHCIDGLCRCQSGDECNSAANPCTMGTCTQEGQCAYNLMPIGTPCMNGGSCTSSGQCICPSGQIMCWNGCQQCCSDKNCPSDEPHCESGSCKCQSDAECRNSRWGLIETCEAGKCREPGPVPDVECESSAGCNDLNPHTIDICIVGKCAHKYFIARLPHWQEELGAIFEDASLPLNEMTSIYTH